MNELMMFEGNEVMVLLPGEVKFEFKGEFLIRAKDVANVLGYQGTSATQEVLKFVKDEQVILVKNSNMVNRHIRKVHNTGEIFITNLGLNRVLGKSEMPKAEPFQDWLFEDVLPSINKHGAYMTMDFVDKALGDPDTTIKFLTMYKEEKENRLHAELKLQEAAPKVAYYNTILKSKGTVTTSQIAKDYGLTAATLNNILHEAKIQYKQNKQWLLYSKHADKGYTQSYAIDFNHKDGTPDVKMNTRWTQRGRIMIHELLVSMDVRPNIDKEYPDVN